MKSVIFVGSVKFIEEMNIWINKLKSSGIIVYHPKDMKSFKNLTPVDQEYAIAGITYGYFQKIRKADVVLLFNINGYAGVSATLELGYATACAKPILSIEKDEELARKVLIEKQVKNVDELVEYLGN